MYVRNIQALLALSLALAQNGASLAQAITACLVSLTWLGWVCWEPPCVSVHRSRVEVADALALFIATAAHAFAMSDEALKESNVPEELFLGDGRDAAAGVTVLVFVLALLLHIKVLLWGHNGAGRRFTKACVVRTSTLTTRLKQKWNTRTPTKSSGDDIDQKANFSEDDPNSSELQESTSASAAPTAESNTTGVELPAASDESTEEAKTSSSMNNASSEPHLSSAAQEKVDTLLVRRMSLDLRGNASFAVELEVG